MPGPPPPPPPPPMSGPPPPPPMAGLPKPAPDRMDLLKSINDPNKPRLKKVDPNQIKDRSKPTVPGGSTNDPTPPVSNKSFFCFFFNFIILSFAIKIENIQIKLESGGPPAAAPPMGMGSLQDQLNRKLQDRNKGNSQPKQQQIQSQSKCFILCLNS